MKILVTGACGYKGTVLIPKLLAAGHRIDALDAMWFGNHLPRHERLRVLQHDVRDIDGVDLSGVDAIILSLQQDAQSRRRCFRHIAR